MGKLWKNELQDKSLMDWGVSLARDLVVLILKGGKDEPPFKEIE